MTAVLVMAVVLILAALGSAGAVALVDRLTALPRSQRMPPVRIQPGQGRHRAH